MDATNLIFDFMLIGFMVMKCFELNKDADNLLHPYLFKQQHLCDKLRRILCKLRRISYNVPCANAFHIQ